VLASCAVLGILPPVKIGDEHFIDGGIVNSIPVARAVALGATTIYVLQVGRLEKPLTPPRGPWEVGLVAFEVARRHRFACDLTSLPDGIRLHVLPTGGSVAPAHNDLSGQLRVRRIAGHRPAADRLLLRGLAALPAAAMMPPTAIRRPVTITAWLLMSTVCLVLSPLLLGLAWLYSTVGGRPQPLIFARLVIAYFALELAALLACGALWLASGGGLLMGSRPFQRLHYRLLRWFVHSFAGRWCALLEIDVPEGESPEATRALQADRPLLLFSRHAGPGDTVVLIDLLLTRLTGCRASSSNRAS
jgi:hypothetical protein